MARAGRARGALVGGLAVVAGSAAAAGLLAPATGNASSHREAPYTAGDPRVDNVDTYAFVSPDDTDTVTVVATFWPLEEPDGGPNFYRFAEGAAYDINIDNDGDAVADLTARFLFESNLRNDDTFLYNTGVVESIDDPDLNFVQSYDLQIIDHDRGRTRTVGRDLPVAPSYVGTASMPDYEALRDEAVLDLPAMGRVFAGQAEDPFFLDLRVFDLLYGGDLSLTGIDTLDGYNVQTLALQFPKRLLAANRNPSANPVVGVWSTTSRQRTTTYTEDGTQETSGDFVQVSRLGSPLVNEVVIPIAEKDLFNASDPVEDPQFLDEVQDPELARLLEAIYGIEAPDSDPDTPGIQRGDLIDVFLTGVEGLTDPSLNRVVDEVVPGEMLRLNMSIPPSEDPERLGVLAGDLAGYPNGRRLSDDVVDISLQAVAGALLGRDVGVLSDDVDANDVAFQDSFPYVALPHNRPVNES